MKFPNLRWVSMALGGVVLSGAIAACGVPNTPTTEAPSSPTPAPTTTVEESPDPVAQAPTDTVSPASSLEIGEFSLQEIYDLNAGGCGMSLWRAEDTRPPGERGFVFINGIEENSMLMKINGDVMRFERTASSGEEFYGQYTSQTFFHGGTEATVNVDVSLGERGEIESVAISEGTIQLDMDGMMEEMAVVGDAGC